MSQEESLEAGGIEEKPNIKAERKPNIEDENLDVDRDNDQEDRKDDEKWSKDKVEALVESFEDCISNQPDMLRDCLKKHPKIPKFISDEGKGNMKEDRKDDDEWFKDVPQHFQTKSEYMRYKAKDRTDNYLQQTKDMLLPENSKDKKKMKKKKQGVLEEFKGMLKNNDFHKAYFDKNADRKERLCNDDGKFVCQGSYIKGECNDNNHHINPYLTEENRKIFSTWHFNHRIQIGRELLPKLKEAVEDSSGKVNLDYFYERLFTKKNFKLVHPACFDKTDHKVEVDKEQVLLSV